ncbi:sensor histidine kinase [Aquimarina addita]|uniref:histidine kinase n=1 Tax=Aquimarina addita TaxID=870485 RepID=A0ABP7X842_9FLAO
MAEDSMIVNPTYSYHLLLKLLKNKKNPDSIKAKTQLTLGSYFNSIGVVDSSLFYTQNSLIHLRNKKELARAYRIMGSSYRRGGQLDDAIKILFKSIKISEEIDYKDMISKVQSDLGLLYANKKEFDKSIQFLKESIDNAQNEQAVYANYINIGAVYFIQNDYDNAEQYFVKAFELMPSDKDPKVAASIALNIGSVLQKNKKYKEASIYYEKSKQIANTHGFRDKSTNATIHKALLLNELGNIKAAIVMLTNALDEAKAISSLVMQQQIHENLSKIYTEQGDYKAANAAIVEFHMVKDSLNKQTLRNEITELEVKYEAEKKEKEILSLKEDQVVKNEEIKRQELLKKSSIIGFLIVLIPITALFLVYYQKMKVKNKYNAQKDEINKQKIDSFLKEQELKLANTYVIAQNEERSRIARELHDSIGGNIAAIKLQMVDIQKNKGLQNTIINQLDETYDQVREISHNLIPKKISQTEFSNLINEYINTIKKVAAPHITFIPHPKDQVDLINDNQKAEIFKIIQELLTNSLKHAKAKIIEICLNAYSDTVEIIFEDDGIGFDKKKEATGIGLQNIRKRLTLLKATMDIDSSANRGTAIRIQIPIDKQ